MFIQESHINATEGCFLGESELYEPFTFQSMGQLFLNLQQEFGRCKGKVYVDTANGSKQVGWVFQKRKKYSDANETYLHETWITLFAELPTRTIEHHYLFLNR